VGPKVFAAKKSTEDESELLILVTPEIVRPMEPDEVPPVPGYEVTHPSDCQLYFHGMTEGPPDLGVYQVGPIGRGATYGREVGYRVFEPAPATPLYSPSVPYPNGNVAPIQVPPTTGPGGPGYGAPAYGGQGFGSGYGGQGFGGDGMLGQPPTPPGGQYPPMAPPAEPAGPLTPIRSRSMGGPQPAPAGPLPAMPSSAFGEPTGQRSIGERFRGILPAGFSRDQSTSRGPAAGSAGSWR
jgi:pilus assembly protein CpaC